LLAKPEGKGPLGRPKRRWEDNIEMDLEEIVWEGVDWISMAQNKNWWRAIVNTFGFLSWLAERLSVSQEGFCSMEWLS
jgi:hypothetical protein